MSNQVAVNEKKEAIYALYQGDTYVDMGTAREMAKKLNISVQSFKFYGTPTYRKRVKEGGRMIIRVEDI